MASATRTRRDVTAPLIDDAAPSGDEPNIVIDRNTGEVIGETQKGASLLDRAREEQDRIIAEHAIGSSSLHGALLIAQRAVGAVEKASTNSYHRYKYASAEDMITAARRALTTAGLVCRRVCWSIDSESLPLPTAVSTFELAHPASAQSERSEPIAFPIIEEKGRPFDKALAGALTSCWSYYLRDLLLMAKEDKESMDTRDDREHQAPVVGTIGPGGAGRLRRQLKAAGLDLDDMLKVMKAAGVEASSDLAAWPREYLDRAETWIAKRTREHGAKQDGAASTSPPTD